MSHMNPSSRAFLGPQLETNSISRSFCYQFLKLLHLGSHTKILYPFSDARTWWGKKTQVSHSRDTGSSFSTALTWIVALDKSLTLSGPVSSFMNKRAGLVFWNSILWFYLRPSLIPQCTDNICLFLSHLSMWTSPIVACEWWAIHNSFTAMSLWC